MKTSLPLQYGIVTNKLPKNLLHFMASFDIRGPARCVYKSLGTCKASQGIWQGMAWHWVTSELLSSALFFCSECLRIAGPVRQSFRSSRLPAVVSAGGQIKFAAKKRESSADGVEALDAKEDSTHWAHWMTWKRHHTFQVSWKSWKTHCFSWRSVKINNQLDHVISH